MSRRLELANMKQTWTNLRHNSFPVLSFSIISRQKSDLV